MNSLILASSAILIGLFFLIWSADHFIESASVVAKHLGLPPLIIGIIIVGFGTSAPEMVVCVFAALDGVPQLALGNAYGSNIANIGLILGITALITPFQVTSHIIRKELPILAAVTFLAGLPLLDGQVSMLDAFTLKLGFFLLMMWSVKQGRNQNNQTDPLASETEEAINDLSMSITRAWLLLIGSCIVLLISSRVLVWGAVEVALSFGISELIIGLTIVAVGTSLPELASSIAAIRKNEPDLALGNLIGSNLFNILAVVGLTGLIQPFDVDLHVLYRDWPVMLGLTAILCWFAFTEKKITRGEGAFLVSAYAGYLGVLTYQSLSL